MLKKFIKSYFSKHIHHHIISPIDMALGFGENGGKPLTAWKHGCILCGFEIVEITESGLEQIKKHPSDKVFVWLKENRK